MEANAMTIGDLASTAWFRNQGLSEEHADIIMISATMEAATHVRKAHRG